MKKAFTLAEVLIMVAILGILASIVMPTFQDHVTEAKEAAAKDTLRILRNAIELYNARNEGVPPGYTDNDPAQPVGFGAFFLQMFKGNYKYMSKMPGNPFNKESLIKMIGNGEAFPDEPTGEFGWIYQPATKTVKIDWPGTDKKGVQYYDY